MLPVVAPERISADSKPAKAEIRRGLKISSWEGALGQIHSALTTSSLLTGFALAWDANDSQLGLLGTIPFLGQLGQLAGAYLGDRFANRRRVVVALLGLAARCTWFILAVLPFLLPARSRLTILAILLVFFLVPTGVLRERPRLGGLDCGAGTGPVARALPGTAQPDHGIGGNGSGFVCRMGD